MVNEIVKFQRGTKEDLERLVICSEADPRNIL